MLCSICGREIIKTEYGWDQGNNAEPVNSGRCCDDCDSNVVIPARLMRMKPEISWEAAMAVGKMAHQPIPKEVLDQITKQQKKGNNK
jgi:hypothetical protein